jgi:hypothetical protein
MEEEFKVMDADASDSNRRPMMPATSDDSDDPAVVFGDHAQLMDSLADYELKDKEENSEAAQDESTLRADSQPFIPGIAKQEDLVEIAE